MYLKHKNNIQMDKDITFFVASSNNIEELATIKYKFLSYIKNYDYPEDEIIEFPKELEKLQNSHIYSGFLVETIFQDIDIISISELKTKLSSNTSFWNALYDESSFYMSNIETFGKIIEFATNKHHEYVLFIQNIQ